MHRLFWLMLATGAAALASGGACTRRNLNFCPEAIHKNCALADAAVDGAHAETLVDVADAGDTRPDVVNAGDVPGQSDSKRDCDSHAQCTVAAKPICDAARGVCVPCVADGQCTARQPGEPGICVEGACPAVKDIIFVDIATGCSAAKGGTPDTPLCDMMMAQVQLANVNEQRRIVVVRGAEQTSWNLTLTRGRVVIIGQPVAKVVIAGQAGISLVGVDVALRRFEVKGAGAGGGVFPGINIGTGTTADLQEVVVSDSQAAGIQITSAKSVRLNRILLTGNATGLRVTQTPFQITNTIIAKSTVAGAVLETAGAAPPRFQNNTLIDNTQMPLKCAANYEVSALLLYPDPGPGTGCTIKNSSTELPQFSTADPTKPYRLSLPSPCRGKGDPTGFPLDDYEGEPRPMGGASDCGADEFTE